MADDGQNRRELKRSDPRQVEEECLEQPGVLATRRTGDDIDADAVRGGAAARRNNLRYEYLDRAVDPDLVRKLLGGLAGPPERAIVYVEDEKMGGRLAAELGLDLYGVGGANADNAAMVTRWKTAGGAILATAAMGAGVGLEDVVLVVCAGPPDSGDQMLEIMGCAGRNGDPATAVLAAPFWTIRSGGDGLLARFATAECRLAVVIQHWGGAARRCGYGDNRCDRCAAAAVASTNSS